jgi:hypothetical protein
MTPSEMSLDVIASQKNPTLHLKGLGLWCLTPLSTIFLFYRGSQFYWWRKQECPEKTIDLSQVTDRLLSHNVVSSTTRLSEIRTHNASGNTHDVLSYI